MTLCSGGKRISRQFHQGCAAETEDRKFDSGLAEYPGENLIATVDFLFLLRPRRDNTRRDGAANVVWKGMWLEAAIDRIAGIHSKNLLITGLLIKRTIILKRKRMQIILQEASSKTGP